ncbi:uncharacterized protein V6R79_025186 [Siganus canaliculatus]
MDLTCSLIHLPITILNAMANAFFIFCIICPLHGERIKQPLKFLLLSFICCSLVFLTSSVAIFFTPSPNPESNFSLVVFVLFAYSLTTSMDSSVWLNFFYFTQIVPARRSIFTWIKKNVKAIIYTMWLFERMFSVFDACAFIFHIFTTRPVYNSNHNFTMHNATINLQRPSCKILINIQTCLVLLVEIHFFFCLCVMITSSVSTAVYLCRHMCRMVENGQSFSCPRLRSQVRVTITGILQGALYAMYTVCTVYRSIPTVIMDPCIHFSIMNLYMAGTAWNLGSGQAVFRQRAADLWFRTAQWFRGRKVQQ